MSGATFGRLKDWDDEILTNEDLNDEIDNILENLTPAGVDDLSTNVTQMRLQLDPGAFGSEVLAESLAEELEQLRFVVARIVGGANDLWYDAPDISINEIFSALGTDPDANRIISGRSMTGSSQGIALTPEGSAAKVKLKGSVTPFIYYVAGTKYTINSDVELTLSLAPTSNNTALSNLSLVTSVFDTTFPQLKYSGEFDTALFFDAAGSELNALNGKIVGLKVNNGTSTEYMMGTLRFLTGSSTVGRIVAARRGFFFDSADAPIPRISLDDNRTITLMKLAYIFAKTDGTLTATYNSLAVGGTAPSSPSIGDYWFDTANQIWKSYNGSAFVSAAATFIGWALTDGTNCVAARTVNFYQNYSGQNTVRLYRHSNTVLYSNDVDQRINVNGNAIRYYGARVKFDTSANMDSGVTLTAQTTYFCYIKENGDSVISDVGPYDRPDMQGYYHPYQTWRCVAQMYVDASSHIDHVLNFQYDEQGYAVTNEPASNALLVRAHSTPLQRWAGNNDDFGLDAASTSNGAGFSAPTRIPFALQTTVPSGAEVGQCGSNNTNIPSYMFVYMFNSAGYVDIGISGSQNFAFKQSTTGVGVWSASADALQVVYGNALPQTNASAAMRLIPLAQMNAFNNVPGTWASKLPVDLTPYGGTAYNMGSFRDQSNGSGPDIIQFNTLGFPLTTSGYVTLGYANATANNIVLPAGCYEIDSYFVMSNSVATNLSARMIVSTANGNNTTTQPSTTGISYSIGNNADQVALETALTGAKIVPYKKIFIELAQQQTIFIVPSVAFSTAGVGNIAVSAIIKRVMY